MSQGVQSHPSCRWQEGPPWSPPRAYGGPADTSISDLCLQSLSEDMSVAERSVCGPLLQQDTDTETDGASTLSPTRANAASDLVLLMGLTT